MVNQTHAIQHHHKRRTENRGNGLKAMYDKFIYGVVIIAPITNIPQLLKVWVGKDASGVSALSWFLFSSISIAWLGYGILHKDKPILLMNAALMVIQAGIAVGAIVYG
jgi:uncharacterized protein with PQ loop repeat